MNAELDVGMKFVEGKSVKRITDKEREKSISPVAGPVNAGFFTETTIEMFKHVIISQFSETPTKARSRAATKEVEENLLLWRRRLWVGVGVLELLCLDLVVPGILKVKGVGIIMQTRYR